MLISIIHNFKIEVNWVLAGRLQRTVDGLRPEARAAGVGSGFLILKVFRATFWGFSTLRCVL